MTGENDADCSSSHLYYSYGLTVDSSTKTIYAVNYNLHTIVAWEANSSNSIVGGGYSLLRNPLDVKYDSNGNLYVAEIGNNRVLLFCQNPSSVALNFDLNAYTADSSNHRAHKFNRIV